MRGSIFVLAAILPRIEETIMKFFVPDYKVHYNPGLQVRWVQIEKNGTHIKRYIKKAFVTSASKPWFYWSSVQGGQVSQYFPTLRDCIYDAAHAKVVK